jgi:fluoride ion exporter CrcB/FEX
MSDNYLQGQFCLCSNNIVMCMSVTIEGLWIGNRVYWTLTDPWLQVIITVSLFLTLRSSLKHTLKSSQSQSLPGSGFNGGPSTFSGFPNSPRPQLLDSNSNSSQSLNRSSSLTYSFNQLSLLTQSLTNQLHSTDWLTDWLTDSVLLITSRHGPRRKHGTVAVYRPLPSNGPTCHNIFLNRII